MPRAALLDRPTEEAPVAPIQRDGDLTALLQRPPQITGAPSMKVSFLRVTPQMAQKWLMHAESDPTFRQRKTRANDVKRWKTLMESGRFIQFLPDGPVCLDEDGVLLNGKHRMTALSEMSTSIGFMVVKGVPRWMFPYFDTGRTRTLNDVFTIAGRMNKAQSGSVMRAAMRYEEFIHEIRTPYGWLEWAKHRDEHADVDHFVSRREPLAELYLDADRAYRSSKMIISSLMVFRFYQTLAWPEGIEQLNAFWTSLTDGTMLAKRSPILALRDWAKDSADRRERVNGKRELHTLLLFRHFRMACDGQNTDKVNWTHGNPMLAPYHPMGAPAAIENVQTALRRLDRRVKR